MIVNIAPSFSKEDKLHDAGWVTKTHCKGM